MLEGNNWRSDHFMRTLVRQDPRSNGNGRRDAIRRWSEKGCGEGTALSMTRAAGGRDGSHRHRNARPACYADAPARSTIREAAGGAASLERAAVDHPMQAEVRGCPMIDARRSFLRSCIANELTRLSVISSLFPLIPPWPVGRRAARTTWHREEHGSSGPPVVVPSDVADSPV
jgi:hypothetical protein